MKTVILNEKRINFDGKIDMSIISDNVTLYDSTNEDEIVERCKNAEVIITKEIKMPSDIVNKLDDTVKIICEAGTGYDNIDLDSCTKKGITVMNVPEYATNSVAEYIMSFMLRISKLNDNTEINGKILGVIGTGKIGMKVIEYAKSFGMNVIAYSRTKKDSINYVPLDELLLKSDYISINLPLTDETYHLLNEYNLSLVKKNVSLINTSRGKVIDENVLIDLLDKGCFKGIALDVTEIEPLPDDSKLRNRDNVILTPHLCWSSIEARKKLIEGVRLNIESFENGNIINKVN